MKLIKPLLQILGQPQPVPAALATDSGLARPLILGEDGLGNPDDHNMQYKESR